MAVPAIHHPRAAASAARCSRWRGGRISRISRSGMVEERSFGARVFRSETAFGRIPREHGPADKVGVGCRDQYIRCSEVFPGFWFPELGERKSALLRAKGREVKCGQGSIVFWESTNPRSPLSDFIGKEGLGPFGLSIEVADLRAAGEIVRKGVGKQRLIESKGSKQSFVLTPDLTGGIWLEFVQT